MLIHYVIVRRDLPIGICAAMITHAAGESGALYQDEYDGRFRGATAVVLEAKSELHLVNIDERLQVLDIPRVRVHETSGTYGGQLMAIGVVPGNREVLAPHMQELQTLKTLDPVVDRNDWGV